MRRLARHTARPGAKVLHQADGGCWIMWWRWCGCAATAPFYPEWTGTCCDGAILHDIWERASCTGGDPSVHAGGQSDRAHLDCAGECCGEGGRAKRFPDKLRVLVEHMILSHHGSMSLDRPSPMTPGGCACWRAGRRGGEDAGDAQGVREGTGRRAGGAEMREGGVGAWATRC